MSVQIATLRHDPLAEDGEIVRQIVQAIKSVRHGQVQIIIQDSRVVQIDTTGGPGFGFEQFKAYDFLRDHEVVLTFDDGPWPGNTPRVNHVDQNSCKLRGVRGTGPSSAGRIASIRLNSSGRDMDQ